MGRRRGNHNAHFGDFIREEQHLPNDCRGEPRLQPPHGPRGYSRFFNDQSERRQYTPQQPWKANYHAKLNRPYPPRTHHLVDEAFITKSKRLKEFLVRSFEAALNQIEQWYPEDSEDLMDWQHEEEIVVERPLEPSYVWAAPSWGKGMASSKVGGDDIPRRCSFSEGLRTTGFGDSKQSNSSTEADLMNGFFTKERNYTSNIWSPLETNSGIV